MKIKFVIYFFIFLLLAGFSQYNYDSKRNYFEKRNVFLTLPKGKTLKILSFGYQNFVADMLFIWSIQFYSDYNILNSYDYIEHVYDVITDLNPKYREPYFIGALIMAYEAKKPESSIRLLEKASKNMPKEWIFYYEAAYYALKFLNDKDLAEELFSKAAEKPGAPSFIKRKIAHIIFMKNDLKTAFAMWLEIYKKAKTQVEKDAGYKHLYEIKAEMDMNLLEKKIEEYRKLYGRNPSSLHELVRKGLIREVPKDFAGDEYIYDSRTGKVKSKQRYKWKR